MTLEAVVVSTGAQRSSPLRDSMSMLFHLPACVRSSDGSLYFLHGNSDTQDESELAFHAQQVAQTYSEEDIPLAELDLERGGYTCNDALVHLAVAVMAYAQHNRGEDMDERTVHEAAVWFIGKRRPVYVHHFLFPQSTHNDPMGIVTEIWAEKTVISMILACKSPFKTVSVNRARLGFSQLTNRYLLGDVELKGKNALEPFVDSCYIR